MKLAPTVSLALAALAAATLAGCGAPPRANTPGETAGSTTEVATETPALSDQPGTNAETPQASERVVGQAPDSQTGPRAKGYALVGDPTIADTGSVTRRMVNITVPRGLTDTQLETAIRAAAEDTAESEDVESVMVFAFIEDGTIDGPATAGRGVLAYGGNWNANAATGAERRFNLITIAPGYRSEDVTPIPVGTVVNVGTPGETIQAFPTKELALSLGKSARLQGPWRSEIFDHVRQVTPYAIHHWYRVRMPYADDNSYKGWVHHGHLHSITETPDNG